MTRPKDSAKTPKPDDDVRLVCKMRRDERAKLGYFCGRIGADMERIAAQWILERLAVEERKLK